ncbi:hypothetical protein [Photobacterium sp. Hal280]|uniref:hypothetical protein n=1 Tax=Photobacterium sp. Hal280 TaxID=3035163 RepID=UPI00301DCA39
MNKLKKSVIAALGLSVIGGSAAYGYFYVTNPYDEEYMENLKYIVEYADKSEDKISRVAWPIYIEIPEEPKIEIWDRKFNMPQIMFFLSMKSKGDKGGLYIMNMNGTDVRILFTQKEIGGIPERKGLSRPNRSPNGRYIITAIQPEGFNYKCAIYDLKNRQVEDLGYGRCYNFHWDKDSNGVYYVGGRSWQDPYYYDVNKKQQKHLHPIQDNFLDELSFEDDLSGGLPIDNGVHYIRQVKRDSYKLADYYGREFKFKLPDMKYIGEVNSLPKNCDYGQNFSADSKYFTCAHSKDGQYYYTLEKPHEKIGKARESLIIQAGNWYMPENSNVIFRSTIHDESTPISGIYYSYNLSKSKDFIGYLSYYLPADLLQNYESMSFSDFFPPLPNKKVYQETRTKIINKE